ncbi:hypothetical protein PHYC_04008 [Phycisphaerales bacterium]|nr:hypothetical protein PHYC_04008 [Phycisphaerales bacterium]
MTGSAPNRKHGIEVVPPRVEGSPADMKAPPADALMPGGTMLDPNGPWWQPSANDIARALGWRWVLIFLLVMAFTGLVAAVILWPRLAANHIATEIKLLVLVVGAGVSLTVYVVKNLVKERADLFCIHCGYSVEALGESGQCPECGRWYHKAVIHEYRKDPHFFQARFGALKRLPRAARAFAAGPVPNPPPDDGTA